MYSYRLFLRNGWQKMIIGRCDFMAEDLTSALKIACQIIDDCSDDCEGYDLLQDGRLISSAASRVDMAATFGNLNAYEQQVVIDREVALRDSAWVIRESKRLLASLEEHTNST